MQGSEETGSAVHWRGEGGRGSHDTALKEHLMPSMLTFITNAKGSPKNAKLPPPSPPLASLLQVHL